MWRRKYSVSWGLTWRTKFYCSDAARALTGSKLVVQLQKSDAEAVKYQYKERLTHPGITCDRQDETTKQWRNIWREHDKVKQRRLNVHVLISTFGWCSKNAEYSNISRRNFSSVTSTTTRSSALAERLRDASCPWTFHCHSRSLKFGNDTLQKVLTMFCISYRFWDIQR